MKTLAGATACLLAMASCATELAEDELQPEVTASALLADCSAEDWRSLDAARFYGARAITEALGNYTFEHPAAQYYFGERHEGWRVESVMSDMMQIANSDALRFSCEPEDSDWCGPESILVVAGDAWRTGDRTVHVCGRRFWNHPQQTGSDIGDEFSQTGAMVHEIAHFAGAVDDGYGEDLTRSVAQTEGGFYSFRFADAYRFYVMRNNDF